MLHSPRIPVLALPCIGWSIGKSMLHSPRKPDPRLSFASGGVWVKTYAPLYTKPVDHDTDIYYPYDHARPTISSVARKFLTTLTCEVIVNGSPLTINTNFMTVNLQVITRNKPCILLTAFVDAQKVQMLDVLLHT